MVEPGRLRQSRIVKAGDAVDLLSFPIGHASEPDSEKAACQNCGDQRQEIERLQNLQAGWEEQLAAFKTGVEQAYDDGLAAGREAAELEFEEERSQALAMLQSGIAQAHGQLTTALSSMENLSLLIAVEAVDKLMSDGEHYFHILREAIRAQLKSLESTSVLSMSVSRLDFPDTSEVYRLIAEHPSMTTKVVVKEDLPRGSCKLDLSLGAVEIDVPGHWGELRELITNCALGEA